MKVALNSGVSANACVDVAVVGAGIVGVCIAYELRKRGLSVVLIDKGEPGQGCSYGNSGAVSPSSVVPLAMPGVLASVPKMLGKPDSPLFLPWWYLPKAAPWLARFVWSARLETVERSATLLAKMHFEAVARHEQMTREVGVPELLIKKGHLHLYPTHLDLDADRTSWELRQRHGFTFEKLDRDGIQDLEPNVPRRYQTGIFLQDQATILNPYRYVRAIFDAYMQRGGTFCRAEVRSIAPDGAGQWKVGTAPGSSTPSDKRSFSRPDTNPIRARHVVIAAGVWTRRLLDPLGIKLYLETQRGYHVQFTSATSPISRTVIFTDKKVFFTPMEQGLRVGGMVEFAGTDAGPNDNRSQILLQIAKTSFSDLLQQPYETWMGHRPCMPDSVPVTGQSHHLPGLWLATGHGHLGLTDSVGTAMAIADGVRSQVS